MPKLDKDELTEVVEELSQYKGRATELITVYVPVDYDINSVQRQLEAEESTAKNIKSSSTRKNVSEALEKIIRYLKELKKTPENGLGIFCGDTSKVEGQSDIQLWSIEPPMPIKTRLYRCDKEFVLEPLEEQLEVSEIYGLLVMDRKEATIGVLAGKRIEIINKMTSGVPGKTRAGGQSSQRFERITEGLTKDFYKRIAEQMKEEFFHNEKTKGILIGGPIPTKDEFLEGEYLPTKLQDKVIGKFDLGGSDESGIKELVTKAQKVLASQEITKERQLLENFFKTLKTKPELALFKKESIERAFQYGAVDKLLLSNDLDKETIKEIKQKAKDIGSDVEMVSMKTEEGKQFRNLSGTGALLRFRI